MTAGQGRVRTARPTPVSPRACAKPELVDRAERLERAYDSEAPIVALDIPDREAILRVLEDCLEELLDLPATLLQEHVLRKGEGA